jgi:hypothetical protein
MVTQDISIYVFVIKRKFRLYIHSAIGEHRTTIGKVWLHHAIYSIV